MNPSGLPAVLLLASKATGLELLLPLLLAPIVGLFAILVVAMVVGRIIRALIQRAKQKPGEEDAT